MTPVNRAACGVCGANRWQPMQGRKGWVECAYCRSYRSGSRHAELMAEDAAAGRKS